jgi:hypothetical protein
MKLFHLQGNGINSLPSLTTYGIEFEEQSRKAKELGEDGFFCNEMRLLLKPILTAFLACFDRKIWVSS